VPSRHDAASGALHTWHCCVQDEVSGGIALAPVVQVASHLLLELWGQPAGVPSTLAFPVLKPAAPQSEGATQLDGSSITLDCIEQAVSSSVRVATGKRDSLASSGTHAVPIAAQDRYGSGAMLLHAFWQRPLAPAEFAMSDGIDSQRLTAAPLGTATRAGGVRSKKEHGQGGRVALTRAHLLCEDEQIPASWQLKAPHVWVSSARVC
jgi:hypothetical protein